MTSTHDGTVVGDRIERQVDIDADATTVWRLISEPGWWINDDRVVEHRIERVNPAGADGAGTYKVHDPHHGSFTLQVVQLREPRYAAFRWLSGPGDEVPGEGSTLVEFFIEDRSGGVVLRVVESGFAALSGDEAARRRAFDANHRGWEVELEAARRHLLGA
ncbi:SRPBCC family protein [Kineococcus arenarius]|uniref:ATPase n=1 Tax=unclassified Kineococcus TaxID=2621656 RepID=UPI003D7EC3F7